jgi:hypothetical protein
MVGKKLDSNQIEFPTFLEGNPQAVDSEGEVETNTGVDFPGLQLDFFAKLKISDFQRSQNSFNSVEMMVVEVSAIPIAT